MPSPICLDELPAHMRRLADDMTAVGAAIRHFGGEGPFGEYGGLIETQSAPILRALADELDKRRGGRA